MNVASISGVGTNAIGQLSNVSSVVPLVDNKDAPARELPVKKLSSGDQHHLGEDQLIPSITPKRRDTKFDCASRMTRINTTIDEHLEEEATTTASRMITADHCQTPQTATYTSYHVGGTPDRPNDTRQLRRLVERTYRDGSRSSQLMRLARHNGGPMAMKIAICIAEYVLRTWEPYRLGSNNDRSRTTFVHFVAALLFQSRACSIVALTAAYYVGRLRRLFPRARGEVGCSHRLFTVSLLIATRYHQFRGPVEPEFYRQWSSYANGVFSDVDLHRMELEFVAFLKFKLHIGIVEFEYFVDRVFGEESCDAQLVPQGVNNGATLDFSRYLNTTLKDRLMIFDEDAAVPTINFEQ